VSAQTTRASLANAAFLVFSFPSAVSTVYSFSEMFPRIKCASADWAKSSDET